MNKTVAAILTFLVALLVQVAVMYALSYPIAYLATDLLDGFAVVHVNGVFEALLTARLIKAAVAG